MSVTTSPPVVVVKEKRGPGCLGCGCGVLIIIFIIIAVLLGALLWQVKQKGTAITTTTPPQLPTYDGGDAMFQEANQKLNDFGTAQQSGQPASLKLSADELNTLIAHNPMVTNYGAHAFVTLEDGAIDLKASFSGDVVPLGLLKGRYGSIDANFTPVFDASGKTLNFTIHRLKTDNDEMPQDNLATLQTELDSIVQIEMQQPCSKDFLDHTKSITVRNGELDIESQ